MTLCFDFVCGLLVIKSNKVVDPFPESFLSKVFGLRLKISRLSATSSLPGVCTWRMNLVLSVLNVCDLVYECSATVDLKACINPLPTSLVAFVISATCSLKRVSKVRFVCPITTISQSWQ